MTHIFGPYAEFAVLIYLIFNQNSILMYHKVEFAVDIVGRSGDRRHVLWWPVLVVVIVDVRQQAFSINIPLNN